MAGAERLLRHPSQLLCYEDWNLQAVGDADGCSTEALGGKAACKCLSCRQYQCRFKRTGQFWTTDGDEALMCLETFWRNDRWHVLYPHVNHLKRNLPALN